MKTCYLFHRCQVLNKQNFRIQRNTLWLPPFPDLGGWNLNIHGIPGQGGIQRLPRKRRQSADTISSARTLQHTNLEEPMWEAATATPINVPQLLHRELCLKIEYHIDWRKSTNWTSLAMGPIVARETSSGPCNELLWVSLPSYPKSVLHINSAQGSAAGLLEGKERIIGG